MHNVQYTTFNRLIASRSSLSSLSGHVDQLATLYSWPQEYEKRVMVLLINYRWDIQKVRSTTF